MSIPPHHPPPIFLHSVVIIENLEGVQYDCLHHLGLPRSISHFSGARRAALAHQRRPKHNCEITRRHPILRTMLSHLVQMQRQLTQSCIIRVRKVVDDGMQRVAADNIILNCGSSDEGLVVCGGEKRVG